MPINVPCVIHLPVYNIRTTEHIMKSKIWEFYESFQAITVMVTIWQT